MNFDLTDSPPRPHRVTAQIVFAPAHVVDLPAPRDCTAAQLVELCSDARDHREQLRQLCASEQYVAVVCELVANKLAPALRSAEYRHARDIRKLQAQLAAMQAHAAQLELAIDAANNAAQVTSLELESERAGHHATTLTLVRELGASIAFGQQAEVLRAENAMLRSAFVTLVNGEDIDHDNDTRVVDVPAGP